MLSKGAKKYVMNPCLGLLPFLLYLILYISNKDIQNSLIVSLLFAAVAEIAIKLYTKTSRGGIMFVISFASLTASLIVWMLLRNITVFNLNIYLILPEIFAVLIFILIRIYKTYINQQYFNSDNVVQKAFTDDFFHIASFTQYFFTLHIFTVLIYKFLKDNQIFSIEHDSYVYIGIPVVGILALIIYENVKLRTIVGKLKTEDWLPIVNEKGEVTGKIAKSVTEQMKNRFMHPVIRIALICNGKIYLQQRDSDDILDAGSLDYPFEKYMLFNQEIDAAVKDCIIDTVGKELPARFLLKYSFDSENSKRLIFLYSSVINDELDIEALSELRGRFWTTKQIEEDFGDDTKFSECFQMEYEYLKNTVLDASNYLKESAMDKPVP